MIIEILYKICNKCNLLQSIDNFYSSKTSKDGKRNDCKLCNNKTSLLFYEKNKVHINELKKQKIIAICDYQISDKCDKNYEICKYELNKNKKNNNGSYRCIKCAATMTHLNKSRKYNTKYNFFSEIENELQAYLLGLIAGDGHIAKNSQYLEVVANSLDIETLELFKIHLSPDNIIRKHSTSENCDKIIICSTTLCNDICKHLQIKPGKKSDKISLPNIKNFLIPHFMRGLLDSDGWVKKTDDKNRGRACFYSSTSTLILDQIQKYLFKLNIKSKIDGIKLLFFGDNASNFLSLLYNNANYFLKRKHSRFLNWR